MIGLFDSGFGGLTVLHALTRRFPKTRFIYLGDHANAPIGNRSSQDVVDLTRGGVETLFARGCGLVILACNTATAVACRTLQMNWLPDSPWQGHNVLGIIAPTVEAATQTPWAVTTPQYPQKYNAETIAIFATHRTVESNVYAEEIYKRCPRVQIVQHTCPELAGAIEDNVGEASLDKLVRRYVEELTGRLDGSAPDRVILGCTHYPLVEHLFRNHLPPTTRLLSQPEVVADSLEDYLVRHAHFADHPAPEGPPVLLTTGDAEKLTATLSPVWSLQIGHDDPKWISVHTTPDVL